MKFTPHIQDIKNFGNWLENFLQKKFGGVIAFVVVILAGVWYSNTKYDEGLLQGGKDSVKEIAQLNSRVKYRDDQIKNLQTENRFSEKKNDSLQSILATRDCTEEVMRYKRLLDYIEISEAEKTQRMNQKLQEVKKQTKELQQTLKL